LPEIVRRADRDITKLQPDSKGPVKGVPLDYFFDVEHLNQTLGTYCPQMKIHHSLNDLYNVPGLLDPIKLKAEEIGRDRVNGTVLAKPHAWGTQLQEYVDLRSPPSKRKYPIRLLLDTPALYTWPMAADMPEVERNFGRILRIRTDARRLAASGLFNMGRKFKLNLDPRIGYHPGSFVGVHLRTERDVAGKFPVYTTQAAYYLSYLVQAKAPVAFLATGATPENITAFTERAHDFNVTVVTKKDILEGDELKLLENLSWDQRALVDYEIMLRAGLLTGTSESAFAWNLALRRAYAFGKGPEYVPESDLQSIQWRDKYTTLYGRNEKANAMKATIWP
jgi:hypothetical protein